MLGKSRNTLFFAMICGSGGPQSRLAKAAGAEPSGQMRDEKLHAVVARSTFGSQNVPDTPFSDQFWKLRCRKSARRCGASTFGSQNVQSTSYSDDFWKLRCVARSTFESQDVQNTGIPEHFWKLRSRKNACRCGAKHISKSKVQKTQRYGALLGVQMSFRVAGAGDCAPCQK